MTAERKCQKCGSAIPAQDINQGRAGFLSGQLLCAPCVQQKRQAVAAAKAQVKQAHAAVAAGDGASSPSHDSGAPIPLAHDPATPPVRVGQEVGGSTKIKRSDDEGGGVVGMTFDDSKLTRPLVMTGKGATRCRIFHTRLNDGALSHMNENINSWLDAHPEIEIKQAECSIGVFQAKSLEQHMIITIFY